MSIKIEKTENKNEVKLEFTVEAKIFEEGMKKVFERNAKYFNIPGFRKGKAPMSIVERTYGSEIFYEDTFNEIVPEIYDREVKENNLEVVSRPQIDIVQIEKGKDLIFTAVVSTKPEVKLGKYKGVQIEKKEYKVEEKDIDAELEQMQQRNSRLVTVTDRAVEEKDIAVIDFEGFLDGKAFDGGKGENYDLEIGSNTFIPGFEEKVKGMKIGEEKDLELTFPEEYFSKDLAGKEVVFKVKLHEIKRKELPTLDDDFAKDVSEFDSLKELKADIKDRLTKSNDEKAKNEMQEAAVKAAVEVSEVELPAGMIEMEVDAMADDLNRRLSYQGMSLDQYLKMINKSMSDFRKDNEEPAKEAIKMRLVLEAIAKDAKIEVTDKDVEAKVKELAEAYGRKEEEINSNEELVRNIRESLTTEKAIEFLVENAKIK